ncbi:MAG TPA: inositol monophosphatase family protein [Bryobacteraceae bacterium]|nr:inositol monophosphatase family protein [Bryobacteraceae bacterium]
MGVWSKELAVAKEAAKQAAELALRYQPGIAAETKPDRSPVTRSDRECERLIAGLLNEAFPEDGILGEEGASVESRNGRRWIVDPIDGTRDYVRGNPLWANLIGLEVGGDVVAGVVNLPVLGFLYSASRQGGAYRNDSPIHVSAQTSIDQAVLCMNAFGKLDGAPFRGQLLDWMAKFWSVRGLGGAADAMMVASGQAEIWIEPCASPWDFAPLKVIVEEAGGVFLNFDGGSTIYAGNAVACAPGLEREARRFLGLSS